MPNPHHLLTTAEVAKRYGVNVRTVSRWVERGELTPVIKGDGLRGPMWFDEDTLPAERVTA